MYLRALSLIGGVLLACWLVAGPAPKRLPGTPTYEPALTRASQPKCPVCGMFVGQPSAWLAAIRFRDGHTVYFDGMKDLFKYYFDLPRYDSGRSTNDVQSVQVTDYYSVETVDGYRAWYVIGSDVLGPMGHELIPFTSEQAAGEFLRDHRGKRVLDFDGVTREVLAGLDSGPSKTPDAETRAERGGAP